MRDASHEPTEPHVTEQDRGYFRRLGEWERANHERAFAEHMALTLEQRLARSWEMTRDLAPFLNKDPEDRWPAEFYERARKLGFC
jgi:hypothetical protein